MDKGAWQATVHGVTNSWTRLSDFTFTYCAKAFRFNQVPFVYFCFYFHYSMRQVKEDLAALYVKECSMFSSRNFIVSVLTFRSLIHFEFIFVYGVSTCSTSILLHVAVQFYQHHLLKQLPFLYCIFLPPLSKISSPQVCGFISEHCILFTEVHLCFHAIVS